MVNSRIILLIVLPVALNGQVSEDFTDGELDAAPPWTGQKNSFKVTENYQLRLDESGSGSAYIATSSHVYSEAVWQFEIEMTFNPSSRNFCQVYLISDQRDLSGQLNGYYVKIGGSEDEISLYRQDLYRHLEIIDGEDGVTDTTSLKLSIKVTRGSGGHWQLYYDPKNLDQYQLLGQKADTTHHRSNFFGFYCQYTSTRAKDFYLDNILVEGLLFTDARPPAVKSIRALDANNIELLFSEPILAPEAWQLIIEGQGSPLSIVNSGFNSWLVQFPFSMESGSEYTLLLNDIEDLFGNKISLSEQFHYWQAGEALLHDVIITEIMADPSPAIKLPEEEYLEIYNRSEKAINLLNWTLADATRKTTLPDYIIKPGEYLVLVPSVDLSLHYHSTSDEINTLVLSSWVTLNNARDLIVLADSTGETVHFVNYSDSWYRSEIKQHGGWSLELIDPQYPCTGAPNWSASIEPTGGTPGKPNSVNTENPDLTPPEIVNTFALSPFQLIIEFDQPLSPVKGYAPEIEIKPPLQIDTFFIALSSEPRLTVLLKDSLQSQVMYQITALGFADCNRNVNFDSGSKWMVGLPQKADSGDLVLNEILFNPKPLGVRFVELYNRSEKAIDLINWRFARWQYQTLTNFTFLTEKNHMIYPGEYRVFTENKRKLEAQYPKVQFVVEVDDLPSLSDKQGSLVLLASGGFVVDELSYNEDMHHPQLINHNGVSLERANPDTATDDANNWYSGSESSGYATPGFQNSQVFSGTHDGFSVEPKIIAPLSSKFPAYVRISFSLESPGNSGSILIFNKQGHLVKTLLNNSLLPINGTYQWDGTNDKAMSVPMGSYIIQLRVIGKGFNSRKWQQTVAVVPEF